MLGIRIVLRDSNVMTWFRAVVSALKIRTVGSLGLMATLPSLSKHIDIGLARFLFECIPIKDKCFVPKTIRTAYPATEVSSHLYSYNSSL